MGRWDHIERVGRKAGPLSLSGAVERIDDRAAAS